jgi:hypothetical protein
MERTNIYSWDELESWANSFVENDRYIFRGQGDSGWPLKTSLARYFNSNNVKSDQWRKRELKMYFLFRSRLLKLCPGLYENSPPVDILSLMQHFGTPTRMLDFSFSPLVAAYFALKDARGNSAIWVIDKEMLQGVQGVSDENAYSGPTHAGGYGVANKNPLASIVQPRTLHVRSAAQSGCFLVPGQISKSFSHSLIHSFVTLHESMTMAGLMKLRGHGIDDESLFPRIELISDETKRFALTGSAEFKNYSGVAGNEP